MPEIKIPYKGDARKIYDGIIAEFPNPRSYSTMYKIDDGIHSKGMYFEYRNLLHAVLFEPCEDGFRNALGFVEYRLTSSGKLKDLGNVWAKNIKDFRADYTDARLKKFIDAVLDELDGINPYTEDVYEIIENLYQKFKV